MRQSSLFACFYMIMVLLRILKCACLLANMPCNRGRQLFFHHLVGTLVLRVHTLDITHPVTRKTQCTTQFCCPASKTVILATAYSAIILWYSDVTLMASIAKHAVNLEDVHQYPHKRKYEHNPKLTTFRVYNHWALIQDVLSPHIKVEIPWFKWSDVWNYALQFFFSV